MKRPLVVFDFDGVVCDSTEECLVTSWNAWVARDGSSDIAQRPGEVPGPVARFFRRHRVFVRSAGEYYVLHRAFDEKISIRSQGDFEKLARRWASSLKAYGKKFFKMRDKLRRRNLQDWIRLHPVHTPVLISLRRLQRQGRLYIVTLKDKRSVELILRNRGLRLNPRRILDESRISDKWDGISQISRAVGVPLKEICFIDDNVTHLREPRRRGVPCWLAGWGYVTQEHRRMAKRWGIPVIGKGGLKKLLGGR